ncbi:MAG: nucleoside-triphosphatase [Candidatus Woesearchaeota archaeon]
MGNNLFLTGDIGAGKSTIIKNLVKDINGDIGGFVVVMSGEKYNWNSFFILPASYCEDKNLNRFNSSEDSIIAKKGDNFIMINKEVFDDYGLDLLSNYREKDIIIMDELGRFELKAKKFQNKVFEILKSNILVLGVIKKEKNIFLNKVREILNNKELLVTKENREEIYKMVKDRFYELRGINYD